MEAINLMPINAIQCNGYIIGFSPFAPNIPIHPMFDKLFSFLKYIIVSIQSNYLAFITTFFSIFFSYLVIFLCCGK